LLLEIGGPAWSISHSSAEIQGQLRRMIACAPINTHQLRSLTASTPHCNSVIAPPLLLTL